MTYLSTTQSAGGFFFPTLNFYSDYWKSQEEGGRGRAGGGGRNTPVKNNKITRICSNDVKFCFN